jgi:hypothetical protein
MKNEVQQYLKEIGSRGGKAGTGKAKARTPEHYKRMTEARERKRRACPDAPTA